MELDIKKLHIELSGKTIIDNLTLHVENKQFVGLLGPNGCGKSTLLKSIFHAIRPQSGTIYLDDMDVLKTPVKTLSKFSGVVNQSHDLNFDFSVRQMVMMGRSPHKGWMERESSRDREIVDKAIASTGLEAFVERGYTSLSGGEKQRVVLARALAQTPKFLLLDEPTNHLDIKYQIQILQIVKSLNIGVLSALHDLRLAAHYCDYIYLMKKGTLVAQGSPEAVLTKDTIRQVYEVGSEVFRNSFNNRLTIVFLDEPLPS